MSQYTVLDRKRDREINRKFMRMLVVSVVAHCLVIGTTAAAYRKPPRSPLRDRAIKVSLRAPAASRTEKPEVKISKPASIAGAAKTVSKPSTETSKTEKEPSKKTVSTAAKKDSSSKEAQASTRVTEADRRLMDSALENISRSVQSEASAEEQAEWNRAFEEITSSLQVRSYYEQVKVIYQEAWVRPPSAREPLRSCIYYVYVIQEGTVQGYKMVQSSGNFEFDQSVLRAVLKVRSLPPVPWVLAEPTFRLPFEFKPDQESAG